MATNQIITSKLRKRLHNLCCGYHSAFSYSALHNQPQQSYQMGLFNTKSYQMWFPARCHVQPQNMNKPSHTPRHLPLSAPPTLPICEITAEWQRLASIESPRAGHAGVIPNLP